MKKRLGIFFLAIFTFSFLVGCGSSSDTTPQTVAINQSSSGSTVSLHQNQIMIVTLPGNGTTGYVWDVVPGSESVLTQQGSEYVPDSNNAGSGGVYNFTFKAAVPGTATLNLNYHRPFETGVAPLQSFQITVSVGS
jgi:inhibitor of cysteine peptidase